MTVHAEGDIREDLPKPVAHILDSYRRTILDERDFLRDSGGRRYKVTNGAYIGKSGSAFAYSFDMESELYLSDDAPISFTVGEISSKGNVLACEDFQILVTLEDNLGERIKSGQISVEPWKLLESLNAKLVSMNKSDKIALALMSEGPALRTNLPIESVATGQDAAMAHAFGGDPVTVIWGPPGTGKTHTMAEIAIRCINEGKSVLAVSHSNISVDGIAAKVAELMRTKGQGERLLKGQVIRYGYVRDESLSNDDEVVSYNYALRSDSALFSQMKKLVQERDKLRKEGRMSDRRRVEVEKEIKGIRKKVSEKEKDIVSKARLVATTVSRVYANRLFEDMKYDVVMFDEVSMAYVPQVICAAMFAKRKMICVGDFRQLPPIAQGKDSKRTLSADIFWYLGICDERQHAHYHSWLVMLNEQRRMHPDIAAFPSKCFYGGLLKDHSCVIDARDAIAKRLPLPSEAVGLIDLGGMYCTAGKNSDNSRFNILSAAVSFALGKQVEGDGGFSVGIIAPYAAQVRLIRAMVQDYRSRKCKTNMSCATVHQFQGSERDAIIMDLVESRPAEKPGILMGSNENGSVDRLVNVGITRARGKLLVVVDKAFWSNCVDRGNSFFKMVDYIGKEAISIDAKSKKIRDFLQGLDFGPNMSLKLDEEVAVQAFMKDIEKASRVIAISIPDGDLVGTFARDISDALERAKARGVDVLMKCRNWKSLPDSWKGFGWQSDDASCPVAMVDQEIAWYGMPPSRGRLVDKHGSGRVTVVQSALRIRGKQTVEMISSLTDLESRVVDGRKRSLKSRRGLSEQNAEGKGADGLSLYIRKTVECPKCGRPMALTRGWKTKKFFLKCGACGETNLLKKDLVNHYICKAQVKCPKCLSSLRSGLLAKVGPHGIYIVCDRGHNIKPDEI